MTSHAAHAVVLATGGYGNGFNSRPTPSSAMSLAAFRAWKRGAGSATVLHPDPPTAFPRGGLPGKMT